MPSETSDEKLQTNDSDALSKTDASSKWTMKLKDSILPVTLTFGIVRIANMVENYLGSWIPGTACGVIALLTPILNSSILSKQSWWRADTTSTLADWFFLLFFASIGMNVDVAATLKMGPACLIFSLLALLIHLAVAVIGSLPFQVELEDVWIASNAAIGGPATAAAFCSRMKNDPAKLRGRTLAATVWGVAGYAIGTVLGVGLYRFIGGGKI